MDENIMSTEEQRKATAAVDEKERLAFNKTHAAWIVVQNLFKPFGDGKPTQNGVTSDKYYAAESDWKVTKAKVKHLGLELRGDPC